jgi:flavin-dependent dehydrogenase
MKSVKIMGAGVSGLSAAINLAKAGYRVDVFEKRSDCGKRFHGDLEGFENWSSLVDVVSEIKSRNIKVNFDCHPFRTMYLSDGKELVEITCKKPIFYLVKRGVVENSLDQGLKNQALDIGVNIHFNSRIKRERVDIISIGPDERRAFGIVKGIRFETESDDVASALFNKNASNRMYSYLLITKGYGCICAVNNYKGLQRPDRYFKKTYDIFNKLFSIDIKNVKGVGGVGCFLLKPRCVENGKLYTGESAGLQDLLWGFGMRYAFNSGYLAALSIMENKNYKKLIKQMFWGRLKTSVVNRYLMEKIGDRYPAFILNQAKETSGRWMDILYRWTNPSFYSRALYPFAKRYLSLKYERIR